MGITIIFRDKIREILAAIAKRIDELAEVSGPASLSAKFEKRVAEVEEVTATLEAPPSAPPTRSPTFRAGTDGQDIQDEASKNDHIHGRTRDAESFPSGATRELAEMAYYSPREAVLEAYLSVEKAAYRLVKDAEGETESARAKGRQLMHRDPVLALADINGIPKNVAAAARDLRHLRNEASNQDDFKINPDVAIIYTRACQNMVKLLQAYHLILAHK